MQQSQLCGAIHEARQTGNARPLEAFGTKGCKHVVASRASAKLHVEWCGALSLQQQHFLAVGQEPYKNKAESQP